jgi:amidohydrolase
MTDLPYASSVEMIDRKGTLRPVMHACGHDMNMASLLGAATLMKNAVSAWNGTFIALFQPDEEYTGGAQAMVDDGLYDLITKPDALLAQHVVPERDGFVAIREGVALAAADSIDIRVFGAPGPGVNPQNAIDSITASYKILARLQNLVAEGFPQEDFVKVWCRSFHAGDKDDDYVELTDMNVDIKTLDPKARENVLAIVKRVVEEESRAARSPKLPIINHRVRAPLTTNDIFIAKRIRNTFDKYFSTNSHEMEIDHASEDFANLAPGIPYAYWNFGGIDAAKWDHAKRENMTEVLIADNHSPFFAPTIQPTLRVGTEAMALAVLDLLINDLEAPSKHDLRL